MKLARFAIFLTGIMGLAIGGIMSISSLRSQQEEALLRTNENLKIQAQIYVDQFFGTLEAVKSTGTTGTLPYVTHRGTVKLNQGVASEVENFQDMSAVPAVTGEAPAVDLGLEERVIKALKNQLSFSDLQLSKWSLGTYELSDLGAKQGMYVATPVYKVTNGVADTTSIEKVNVALIDPVKAFSSFSKISSKNVFLIGKDGRVLAHSAGAYVGTDLKKIESLHDTIENLFLGAQTGSVGHYNAVDGTREQVAFIRAGTYPFAIGVDQKATPAVLSAAWVSDQVHSGSARKNLGMLSVLIGMALGLFSMISFILSREIKKQIHANAEARFERDQEHSIVAPETGAMSSEAFNLMPPPPSQLPRRNALLNQNQNQNLNQNTVSMPSAIAHAAKAFQDSRESLKQELTQSSENANRIAGDVAATRNFIHDFSERVKKGLTIEGIEKELVNASAELTHSSVLYLRYHRKTQNLGLSAVAGDVQIPNYSAMQAYVRKDIEQQVEMLANEGKVASITNYGPMSKMMMTGLNSAQFEAWAVTSDPEISGESKLVGVIVVLQSGFQNADARPILAKLLREGGNYLYAQAGKIRSRSGHASSVTLTVEP